MTDKRFELLLPIEAWGWIAVFLALVLAAYFTSHWLFRPWIGNTLTEYFNNK